MIVGQHVISAWFSRQPVSYDNWLCAQMIAADWDNETVESDIATVTQMPFIKDHASFVYTTQSHTPDAPRCRAIFLLDKPCYDPELHRRRTRAVAWALDSDMQATNPSRLFHGSGTDGNASYLGKILEVKYADFLVNEYDLAHPSRAYSGNIVDSGALMAACLKHAQEGKRNGLGFWAATKLRDGGVSIEDAEAFMRSYQEAVDAGSGEYTWTEARESLRSAYSRKVTRQC